MSVVKRHGKMNVMYINTVLTRYKGLPRILKPKRKSPRHRERERDQSFDTIDDLAEDLVKSLKLVDDKWTKFIQVLSSISSSGY